MRRLLIILSFATVSLTGCVYKYSQNDGWQYNEQWTDSVVKGVSDGIFNHDDRDALEKQRDEFYDTPAHRLHQRRKERRKDPEVVIPDRLL